jgi:hypothetical protein
MSLPKKIAALAAPVACAAFLLAVPASAQSPTMMDSAKTAGPAMQASVKPESRGSTKEHAPGTMSGQVQAPKVANSK